MGHQQPSRIKTASVPSLLARVLLLGLLLMPSLAQGQVLFSDCVPVAGGGVSCDALDAGDTALDANAARDGLPEQSSSSWAEFDPYDSFDNRLGNN